jgi:hypothetical protein
LHSPFKKGQSRAVGRRKTCPALLAAALNQKVTVTENGKRLVGHSAFAPGTALPAPKQALVLPSTSGAHADLGHCPDHS